MCMMGITLVATFEAAERRCTHFQVLVKVTTPGLLGPSTN